MIIPSEDREVLALPVCTGLGTWPEAALCAPQGDERRLAGLI
ncbi:hypothetical protein [Streptomyces albidoflavus]|nr:hypothetical protein [Streptomyces albidoflavus]